MERFRLGRHEQVAREALHLGSGGKSEVGPVYRRRASRVGTFVRGVLRNKLRGSDRVDDLGLLETSGTFGAMKVREVIRMLEDDGWQLVRTRGSHRQFRHPAKPGTVTVAGKASLDVPFDTFGSILKQAGLKKE